MWSCIPGSGFRTNLMERAKLGTVLLSIKKRSRPVRGVHCKLNKVLGLLLITSSSSGYHTVDHSSPIGLRVRGRFISKEGKSLLDGLKMEWPTAKAVCLSNSFYLCRKNGEV